MPETYRRSNLGSLRPGDAVNLERSVRPSDRLSGHIVRGVVEGVGALRSMTPEADAIVAWFDAPRELLRYMVVKGPICIDGISLTIIAKDDDGFAVSLVQYREHTNLGTPRPTINLETDIIARYVQRFVRARGEAGVTPKLKPTTSSSQSRALEDSAAAGSSSSPTTRTVKTGDLVMAAQFVTPTPSTSWRNSAAGSFARPSPKSASRS
jgi:hypothetical protein